MTERTGLDDLDRRLIAALRLKGRAANRTLAAEMGVAETTIAARIRRLSEQGWMRVSAVVDMASAGFPFFALVGVRVSHRDLLAVSHDLAGIPEVASVSTVLGRFDIVLSVMARDQQHLRELLEEQVATVKGVERLEPHLALSILRYRYEWTELS